MPSDDTEHAPSPSTGAVLARISESRSFMTWEQVQGRAGSFLAGCPDGIEELVHPLQGSNAELQRVVRSMRLQILRTQRVIHGSKHHPHGLVQAVPVLRPPLGEGP